MSKYSQILFGTVLLTSAGCDEGWSETFLVEGMETGALYYYAVPRITGERGTPALVYGWPGASPSGHAESTTELHALVIDAEAPGPNIYPDHTDLVSHAATDSGIGEVTFVYNTDSSGLLSAQWAGGVWTSPVVLAEAGERPRVVSDERGNVLAAWKDEERARAAYLRAFPEFGVPLGWAPPVELNGDEAADLSSVNLAMNSEGDAIAAWCEAGKSETRIMTRRFWRETGWDTKPYPLATVPECLGYGAITDFQLFGRRNSVDVGISDLGVASVVWTDGDLKYSEHTPSTGWAAPTLLAKAGGGIEHLRLAVSPRGHVSVAWMFMSDIWARVFTRPTWGTSVVLRASGNPSFDVGIADSGIGMIGYISSQMAGVARINGDGLVGTDTVGEFGDYEVDLAVQPNGTAYVAIEHAQRSVHWAQYTP